MTEINFFRLNKNWHVLKLLTIISYMLIIGANEKFSFPLGFLVLMSLPFSFTSEFFLMPIFVFASSCWLMYSWNTKKNIPLHHFISMLSLIPYYIHVSFILKPSLQYGGILTRITLIIFAVISITLILTLLFKILEQKKRIFSKQIPFANSPVNNSHIGVN